MSKKKSRQRDTSSAASAKGSAAANRTGRRGPFPIVIAAVAILLVVAALWAVKGLAEPSGEAGTAEEVSPAAASSTAPTSSSSSDIWSLAARSVDMDAIAEANVPAIVDFGSDSCIPCKQMAPVLKKSNEEMRGRAIVKFVDVWKYADAADGFPVQVIPTQVLMIPTSPPRSSPPNTVCSSRSIRTTRAISSSRPIRAPSTRSRWMRSSRTWECSQWMRP